MRKFSRTFCHTARKISAAALAGLLIVNIAVPLAAAAAQNGRRETVKIGSARELAALAENCVLDTWSKNKDVVLIGDIDLSNTEFTAIPLFMGHFDGGGYRIFGLEMNANASTAGLFRRILQGGVVENVTVSGAVTPGGTAQHIGGIVGENHGTVKNCTFVGTVGGTRCVGGIAGLNGESGIIEACVTNGTVEGDHCIGGIAGENDGTLMDCVNRAAINTEYDRPSSSDEDTDITYSAANLISNTASADDLMDIADLGGITGYSKGIVRNCTNAGNVGYPHVGYNIGGIVGRQFGLSDGCINKGFIQGRKDVGGIVGQLEPEAKWDYDNSSLQQLKAMLNELQTRMEKFSNDLSAEQSAVSADITKALNALGDTSDAVQTMIDEDGGETAEKAYTNAQLIVTVDALSADLNVIIADLDRAAETALPEDAAYPNAKTETESALRLARTSADQMHGELEALRRALEESDISQDKIDAAAQAITGCEAPLQAAIDSANAAIGESESKADYESVLAAVERTRQFAQTAGSELSGQSYSSISTDSAAKNDVLSSLSEVNAALKSATDRLSVGTATDDLQAVSDQLMAIMNFMFGMMGDRSGVQEYVEDISAKSSNHTTGTIRGCENRADVSADTNVGGVVGAVTIELAFDQEDELNLSAMVSGRVNYVIYAAVRDCVNAASVKAGKAASGGIAGRMDYGAAIGCESSGNITSSGNYAGGIVGYCLGTVKSCFARVNVSAVNHTGGIAGLGADISDCMAIPNISPNVEFQGSIAGTADGALSQNYYAQSRVGGVDGFSFEGKAQAVSYEELLKLSENKALFRTITVTFVVEDEIVSAFTVPFGGSVSRIPSVPNKDGRYWKWDDFDNNAIYRSITVEGQYCSPIQSLASGEDVPQFIVEGEFYDGQSLTVLPYSADVSVLGLTEEDILRQNTLSVEDYDSALTVRMREEEEGRLFVTHSDGRLEKAVFERDGSYIVFELDNGGSFVYVKSEKSVLPWVIGGGAGAAAIVSGTVTAVLLVRRRRKKKGVNAPVDTEQTEASAASDNPVEAALPQEQTDTPSVEIPEAEAPTEAETPTEEDSDDQLLPEAEAPTEGVLTDIEAASNTSETAEGDNHLFQH